ncbi:unnamed protein product [Linum trigynum]|uniref:Uncharacterized protein n=1 Tax=Linum trigynum TaxID=586398 RepID=A0AAV2G136_9ROSI
MGKFLNKNRSFAVGNIGPLPAARRRYQRDQTEYGEEFASMVLWGTGEEVAVGEYWAFVSCKKKIERRDA